MQLKKLAEVDGVELRYYNIILRSDRDDVKKAMTGLLSPDMKRAELSV
ncbi:hypothetical protein ACP8HZ_00620 [Francisella noatunensis]